MAGVREGVGSPPLSLNTPSEEKRRGISPSQGEGGGTGVLGGLDGVKAASEAKKPTAVPGAVHCQPHQIPSFSDFLSKKRGVSPEAPSLVLERRGGRKGGQEIAITSSPSFPLFRTTGGRGLSSSSLSP